MTIAALEKSFSYLWKNPILFVPDIVLLIVTYLMLYLIYLYTGVGDLLSLLEVAEKGVVGETLKSFLSENLLNLLISAGLYIFVTFMIGVSVAVIKYSMVRQILESKKSSLLAGWKEKKHYFWFVVLLRILIFVIGIAALVVVALIAGLIYLIINPFTSSTVAISIAGAFAVPLTVLSLLLVKLLFFFRYPIMFMDTIRNPFRILKRAFRFSMKEKFYVIVTWLVIFVLGIFSSILLWFVSLFLTSGTSMLPIAIVTIILTILISILNILIKLAVELWGTIFLFIRYKQKS